MLSLKELIQFINSEKGEDYITRMYGASPEILPYQRERHLKLVDQFNTNFKRQASADLFSSPGRTEVGGNHTDHNAGRILAAAIDLDIIALAACNDRGVIQIHSEGYPLISLRVDDLDPVINERYTSTALVRGVCARFMQLGFSIGGFDAATSSLVPKGSGLSSSAAYEVLIAAILNNFYNNGQIDPIILAQISQYAENQFFGKPCGLMDQTICAVGGFVTIDFKDFQHPIVKKLDFDFGASGYIVVIVDTWGDHAGLNDEYAALEHEMASVASTLGGQVLREFSLQIIMENIPYLHARVSDRAILRAIHFYQDDQRVVEQVQALENGNIDRFLQLINESGQSSWMLCQNCYSPKSIERQGISIALAASEFILKDRGAWRVHGGGFAGSIQAFVPNNLLQEYVQQMDGIFGTGSCHAVRVRQEGGSKMKLDHLIES